MSNPISDISKILNHEDDAMIESVIERLQLNKADIKRMLDFASNVSTSNGFSTIKISVPGDVAASKRPRASTTAKGVRMYAPDAEDQQTLHDRISLRLPDDFQVYNGEVQLFIQVYKSIPKSYAPYKVALAELGMIRPTNKPDYDNYAKLITDAMRKIVYTDDSQITVGSVEKYYSLKPRLDLEIYGRSLPFKV